MYNIQSFVEQEKTHQKRVSQLQGESDQLKVLLQDKEVELSDVHELQDQLETLTERMLATKQEYDKRIKSLTENNLHVHTELSQIQDEKRIIEDNNMHLFQEKSKLQNQFNELKRINKSLQTKVEKLEKSNSKMINLTTEQERETLKFKHDLNTTQTKIKVCFIFNNKINKFLCYVIY